MGKQITKNIVTKVYIHLLKWCLKIHYIVSTSGKVHPEGDIVMTKEGNPYCLTASIKNK